MLIFHQDIDEQDENSSALVNAGSDTARRPSRKVAKVDYKSILALENLESEKNFEKYMKLVSDINFLTTA